MGRLLVALLAAALAVAGTAQAKGPHAILTPGGDPAEAGRSWEATLELMEFRRASNVALVARQGKKQAIAALRPARTEFQDVRRYDARLAFPSEGRWTLVALSGKRRFEFAPVGVGSGRVPEQYTAFAGQAYARSRPLAPEAFSVAAAVNDDDGVPLWILPIAGAVLAGAGVLRLRSR